MKNGKATKGERASFSGRLGYVLATADSAVGLGNIWRFPYLAAKYGGGIFVLVYVALALTFGYTLMVSETAIGRMTRKSAVGAFRTLGKSKASVAGGWVNAIIPILILPYYSVIGGWVCRYLFTYITGQVSQAAGDAYFTSFLGSAAGSEFWFLVFALATIIVIVLGVEGGVERISKIMMPAMVVLGIFVAIYSMTRPGALEGVKYFLVPNFSNFSWMTVVAALGQMFYSLSCAMGILVTYGSYMKNDVDVEKASRQVIFFDSGIAILAGMMIIPAVFAFSNGDAATLKAGPSLMFITMPKIFDSMGFGRPVGIVFFLLVLFAALTSSISLAETCVSTFQDELGWKRLPSSLFVFGIMILLGSLSSLGYNLLSFVKLFGMEILDFFDFLTNSLMMPIAALIICALVIFAIKPRGIAQEIKQSSRFTGEKMYSVIVRFVAPVFILVIFITSVLSVLGVFSL